MNARPLALIALASLAVAGGCTTKEKYSYVSTPDLPKTVTLKDWTTGESLWSYEIPVGKQLNIKFAKGEEAANTQGWDEMTWTVGTIGKTNDGKPSTMRVPPPNMRRFDIAIRQVPEARPQPTAPKPVDVVSSPAPETAKPKSKPAPEGVVMPDPNQAPPK